MITAQYTETGGVTVSYFENDVLVRNAFLDAGSEKLTDFIANNPEVTIEPYDDTPELEDIEKRLLSDTMNGFDQVANAEAKRVGFSSPQQASIIATWGGIHPHASKALDYINWYVGFYTEWVKDREDLKTAKSEVVQVDPLDLEDLKSSLKEKAKQQKGK